MKTFNHVRLIEYRYIIFFLIPFYLLGCWPAPYYHSWNGHIATPTGKPVKDATVIMVTYHSCGNLGGGVRQLLDVKTTKTDADSHFSIFTIGINLDYFALIALCFGTDVEKYVCSKGKWELEEKHYDLEMLYFDPPDPATTRSYNPYWGSGHLSREILLECGWE